MKCATRHDDIWHRSTAVTADSAIVTADSGGTRNRSHSARNHRSRSTGMPGHDGPESSVTIPRNTQYRRMSRPLAMLGLVRRSARQVRLFFTDKAQNFREVFSLLMKMRIPAKVNGDSGIVNTDPGAVNGNSGQCERGGTGGSMLRAIILGRGGFSADGLLFLDRISVFFRGQFSAGSNESPVLALPAAGFLRKDSPVIVKRWWFCMNRSSMASTIVGSPIHSCQCSMGS